MPAIRYHVTALAILLCLAATACTRVTTHVAVPELQLGEPSYFPTQEAYGGAPIVGGNSVEILLNGENIFPTLVEGLRSAKRTISYAQYYYEDGPVARDVADALADRCRAGVGVNVLLDSFGSLSMPKEYVDLMRASGCHVEWFRPLSPLAIRRSTPPAVARSRSSSGSAPVASTGSRRPRSPTKAASCLRSPPTSRASRAACRST